MKERHQKRIRGIVLTTSSALLIALAGGKVFFGRDKGSFPAEERGRTLDYREQLSQNAILPESSLADLDRWIKKDGEDGEEIFTAQIEDGFWANIVVSSKKEVWSADKYASDLLAKLREVDNDARFITSDMTTEDIKIPKGGYLLVGRFRGRSESIGLGLDGLQYWLVIPKGVFNDKVSVLVLTMQSPHSLQEMVYQKQAVQALQSLAENLLSKP